MPIGPGSPTAGGIPGFNIAYVTAHAGGGITSATALPAFTNVVTAATASDSVILPPCWAGAQITVVNNGSVAVSVYAYAPTSGAVDSICPSAVTAVGSYVTGQSLATAVARVYLGIQGEGGNTVGGTGSQYGGVWKQISPA